MRFARVTPVVVLALGAMAVVGVWLGVPWYVNSGRAARRLEAQLLERTGSRFQVDGLRMDGWLTVTATGVRAEDGSWAGTHLENLAVETSVLGLLRRRFDRIEAARAVVVVPAEFGPAAAEGKGERVLPRLPTIRSLRVPELRILQATGDGATRTLLEGAVTSSVSADERVVTHVNVAIPIVSARVTGRLALPAREAGRATGLLEIAGPWQPLLRLTGLATAAAQGDYTGSVEITPDALVLACTFPSFEWEGLSVAATSLDAQVDRRAFALASPIACTIRTSRVLHASTPDAPLFLLPDGLTLQAALEPRVRERQLGWSDTTIVLNETATITTSGAVEFAREGLTATAHAAVPALPVAAWAEYVPALRRLTEGSPAVGGAVALETTLALRRGQMDVRTEGAWSNGTVVLDDFHQAAGLRAALTASVRRPQGAPWSFSVEGDIGAGELLWGALYQDFSARTFPVRAEGWFAGDTAAVREVTAAIDLADLGAWSVTGDVALDAPSVAGLEVAGRGIGLGAIASDIVVPAFEERRPWITDLRAAGTVDMVATLNTAPNGVVAQGRLTVADGRIADPTDDLELAELQVSLPFRLGPGAEASADAPPEIGTVAFAAVQAGPLFLDGAEIPLQVWNNTGVFAAPYQTALFGGTLMVDAMWGVHLLTPQREWQAEVTLTDIDLGQASAAAQTILLIGKLNGRFSRIHFANNNLDADGAIKATIYDGAFHLTHFGIRDVTSPYRTLQADVSWEGINLALATAALDFGKITGILAGHIRGLEVQAGQPAAFEAEFRTVPTRDVPQTISVKAVNNIALLGTGRGLGGTLSRGLTAFFDEYKYDTIGFACSLTRDQFRIRGGATAGGTEYFVRGTLLPPTINVVNRDPNTVISFKEMMRRVSALSLPKAGSGDEQEKGS